MFHKSINRIGTIAMLAVAAGVLASAGSEFLHREIGGIALLVVAQTTIAAAIFFSTVLAKVGDHETLSVYRAMNDR